MRALFSKRHKVLAAIVVAIAAVATMLWRPRPTLAPSASRATFAHHFGWVAGRAYAYDLSFSSKQRATPRLDAQPIDAEIALEGALVVRCYEASAEGFRLGVSFDAMKTAKLQVNGARTIGDPSTLVGDEAIVVLDARGAVLRWQARSSASDAFKAVAPNVVALLQITLPAEAAALWESDDATMLGTARAHYSSGDDPRRIERQHLRYLRLFGAPSTAKPEVATLASSDVLVFGDDDVPQSIHVHEELALADALTASVEADVRRTGDSPFAAAPSPEAELETHTLGERASADVERKMLQQLAAGLTMDRFEIVSLAHAPGAKLPPGFITSAVALVKLDPGLADALVEIFERPSTSLAARALLLDVLASAGHARAQAAMRDALASAAAQQNPRDFGVLLQRVGMLVSPEVATVDFTYRTYDGARNADIRAASAYALGATLATRPSDPALAKYGDRLRKDVVAAKSAGDRVTLLAALGNAASARDVKLIASFAHDKDARVRRQVAMSLRRGSMQAKEVLFGMLGDAEIGVGNASLESLGGEALTERDLARLSAMVGTPGLPGMLHESLITIVGSSMSAHREHSIAILRAIVAASSDPHTSARARMVLGQLGVD